MVGKGLSYGSDNTIVYCKRCTGNSSVVLINSPCIVPSTTKQGGIMAFVFSGRPPRAHSSEMTMELSMEMNRKMQSVLEDTLLKNITLKVSYMYMYL